MCAGRGAAGALLWETETTAAWWVNTSRAVGRPATAAISSFPDARSPFLSWAPPASLMISVDRTQLRRFSALAPLLCSRGACTAGPPAAGERSKGGKTAQLCAIHRYHEGGGRGPGTRMVCARQGSWRWLPQQAHPPHEMCVCTHHTQRSFLFPTAAHLQHHHVEHTLPSSPH